MRAPNLPPFPELPRPQSFSAALFDLMTGRQVRRLRTLERRYTLLSDHVQDLVRFHDETQRYVTTIATKAARDYVELRGQLLALAARMPERDAQGVQEIGLDEIEWDEKTQVRA